jgi:hypothetical protein
MEQWRTDHRQARDATWEFLLEQCEANGSYELLDRLQALTDSTFDALEQLLTAHHSLSQSLQPYEELSLSEPQFDEHELEVISSIIEDIEKRTELLGGSYLQAIARLMRPSAD